MVQEKAQHCHIFKKNLLYNSTEPKCSLKNSSVPTQPVGDEDGLIEKLRV